MQLQEKHVVHSKTAHLMHFLLFMLQNTKHFTTSAKFILSLFTKPKNAAIHMTLFHRYLKNAKKKKSSGGSNLLMGDLKRKVCIQEGVKLGLVIAHNIGLRSKLIFNTFKANLELSKFSFSNKK